MPDAPLRVHVTALSGFSRKTVETVMRTGELRASKVRGRWITRADWVDAWLYPDVHSKRRNMSSRLYLTP